MSSKSVVPEEWAAVVVAAVPLVEPAVDGLDYYYSYEGEYDQYFTTLLRYVSFSSRCNGDTVLFNYSRTS